MRYVFGILAGLLLLAYIGFKVLVALCVVIVGAVTMALWVGFFGATSLFVYVGLRLTSRSSRRTRPVRTPAGANSPSTQ